MVSKNKLFNILVLIFISSFSYGQLKVIDSLNVELSQDIEDTVRFQLVNLKVLEFRKLNLSDSAISLSQDLHEIANKTNEYKFIQKAYKQEFNSLNQAKFYDEAKQVYLNYIDLLKEKEDTVKLAEAFFDLGVNEHQYGNTVRSLEYFFQSSHYYETIGNPIRPYRALAITYGLLNDLNKAYDYNQKVIDLATEKKDYKSLARGYLSKGYQLKEMNRNAESLIASKKAVDIYVNELNDSIALRLSLIYGNIAEVYLHYHQNDLDSVIYIDSNFSSSINLSKDVLDSIEFFLNKSLIISKISNSKHHVYNAKVRYADYFSYLKKFKKSLKLYYECYDLCHGESNMLSNEMGVTAKLYKIYKEMNIYDKSLKFYELNLILQDSLYNEDKQRDVGKQEAKFEFEKQKVLEDAERAKTKVIEEGIAKKEKAIAVEQNKKQRIITYVISLGVLLVSIFTLLVFRRLKVAKAQQLLIEDQKKIIEKDRNQMLESIEYSRNIQQRIFPTLKEVKKLLPNSFLYFNPKDVVSGDFYWVHHKGNKTYFSVADCTGHGVPGAFMTLISLNLINAIVLEEDVDSTSKILERLHVKLKERLTSSEEEQMKHGLDIAMCAYNHDTNELEFSGLHNPIYIINKDNELIEIKGDNLFLGISSNFKVTRHIININAGDSIYMSTDGYADQKGGSRGKKYYYSRLRNSLRIVDTKPLEERSLILDQKFKDWKGELEQIDDVCIMGVSF